MLILIILTLTIINFSIYPMYPTCLKSWLKQNTNMCNFISSKALYLSYLNKKDPSSFYRNSIRAIQPFTISSITDTYHTDSDNTKFKTYNCNISYNYLPLNQTSINCYYDDSSQEVSYFICQYTSIHNKSLHNKSVCNKNKTQQLEYAFSLLSPTLQKLIGEHICQTPYCQFIKRTSLESIAELMQQLPASLYSHYSLLISHIALIAPYFKDCSFSFHHQDPYIYRSQTYNFKSAHILEHLKSFMIIKSPKTIALKL